MNLPANHLEVERGLDDAKNVTMSWFRKDLRCDKEVQAEFEGHLETMFKERSAEILSQNQQACHEYASQML